jgi:hypothetical protein
MANINQIINFRSALAHQFQRNALYKDYLRWRDNIPPSIDTSRPYKDRRPTDQIYKRYKLYLIKNYKFHSQYPKQK